MGKFYYLGIFDTKEEAAVSYNNASIKLHKYGRLNNIKQLI